MCKAHVLLLSKSHMAHKLSNSDSHILCRQVSISAQQHQQAAAMMQDPAMMRMATKMMENMPPDQMRSLTDSFQRWAALGSSCQTPPQLPPVQSLVVTLFVTGTLIMVAKGMCCLTSLCLQAIFGFQMLQVCLKIEYVCFPKFVCSFWTIFFLGCLVVMSVAPAGGSLGMARLLLHLSQQPLLPRLQRR